MAQLCMAYTIDRGDGPQALLYGPFVDADGTQHTADVLGRWSDAELAEIGVSRSVDLPASQAACVTAIKAEAERRILDRYPIQTQLNMIRAGESLDWIDQVRAASNEIEADVPQDAEALAAFDIAAHAAWPA